mgnify:CR=1 FL=1
MNKKFLSAILFGAALATSTGTFVSCKDYDEDIDFLQTQIDQNASSLTADMAAKIAALESQISALNSAKQDLAVQLATAKSEVAAAMEAAKDAQGDADELAKTISEAVARVSVLEQKSASLESVVAGLQDSKAQMSASLNSLQASITALQTDTKLNSDAIAAANAEIVAKAAELNAKIAEVSKELGAEIDAIDASLNEIAENYVSKDALTSKANELAATDAQLQAQIDANANYIKGVDEAIEALEGADKDIKASLVKSQEDIAGISEELETLKKSVADQNKAIEAQIVAAQDAAKAYTDQVAKGFDGRLTAAEDLLKQLVEMSGEDLSAFITKDDLAKSLEAYITSAEFEAAFEEQKEELAEAIKALEAGYEKFQKDIEKKIEDEVAKLAKYNESLVSLTSATDALAKRIQSIVFIPEIQDKNGNVFVPAYFYSNASSQSWSYSVPERNSQVTVKFRVQPAVAAAELEALFSEKAELISLEASKKLETRAVAEDQLSIDTVIATNDGILTVVADANFKIDGDYPFALVINGDMKEGEVKEGETKYDESENATKISSDYFVVRAEKYTYDSVEIATKQNLELYYSDLNVKATASDYLKQMIKLSNGYSDDFNAVTGLASDLQFVGVTDGTNYYYFNDKDYAKNSDNFWKNTDAKYFVKMDANNNAVQVAGINGAADKNAIGKKLTVIVKDNAWGEVTNNGNTYNVWYKEVEFEIKDKTSNVSANFGAFTWTKKENGKDVVYTEYAWNGGEDIEATNVMKVAIPAMPEINITDKQLTDVLNNEYSSVDYKFKSADGTTLPATIKITVNNTTKQFEAKVEFESGATIKYQDYSLQGCVIPTEYGKITLNGSIKLVAPDAADILKHSATWLQNNKWLLGYADPVKAATEDYEISMPMSNAFVNYEKYTKMNCVFSWSLNEIEGFNHSKAIIKGVSEDDIKNGILSLTEQVTIEKTVDKDGNKDTLTGADALAAISFTVVVKDKNGAEIAKEVYGISGAYPINYTFDTQSISISEAQMKNSAADSRIISNGVNFTDKFGNAWLTKGDVNDAVVPVWGVNSGVVNPVKFEVVALYVNGEKVDDIWGITVDNLVKDSKGKYVGYALNCVNYNWTSDLTVKVKASVNYKYGTVSTTYEVKLAANTGN